jgi:hypothetical protein
MIVAPLSASRGTHTGGVHVIAQGDEFEDMLLGSGRHDVSYAPAAGTVAATALRLAVTFSEWPIVYAGLDMARYRGRTHARPHLAHAVRSAAATRTLPPETQVYHLQGPAGGDWQTERSLDAYAAWFRSRPAALARAQRLFPSPVPVSMAEMTPSAFGRLPRRYSGMTWQPAVWPDRGERRRTVHDVVARCRTMLGAFTGGATPRDAVVRNRPAVLLALRLAPQHAVRWYRGDEAAGGIVRETVERELNALEEMCP